MVHTSRSAARVRRGTVAGLTVAAILLLSQFLSLRAAAQTWVRLADFGKGVMAIHFLDREGAPRTGFVGLANGSVYRTTDGGNSWQQCSAPGLFGIVSSFSFKDQQTGWLSCRQVARPACYKTTDGGVSWTPLSPTDNRFCVYYNTGSKRLFLSGINTNLLSSPDDGTTWTNVGPSLNGIAFSGPLIGVVTTFSGSSVFTHDGGRTWIPGNNHAECWNPLAISGTSIFFAVSELTKGVSLSADGGNAWQYQGALPDVPTGDIRGTCSQLYVQSHEQTYYSNNEGITWNPLRGPGNQSDTRFYVLGDHVYAGDTTGKVFLLVDIDRPPVGSLKFSGSIPNVYTRNCKGVDTVFTICPNNACLATTITGIDTIATSGMSVRVITSIPKTLSNIDNDSLKLIYRPLGGEDSLKLTVHYKLGAFPYDTTITFYGRRDQTIAVGFQNAPINLWSATACRVVHGRFTLLNNKCDSLELLSVFATDTAHFGVDPLFLPGLLMPYGSYPISVHGSTNGKDTLVTTFKLVVRMNGHIDTLSVDASLTIGGIGPVAMGVPTFVNVPPTNVCRQRIVKIPIVNNGCVPITCFAPRWVIPVKPLAIYQQPNFPITLAGGEQDSILILYSPDSVANLTGVLGWRFQADQTVVDTMIQIRTSSYSLSRATLSESTLAFDSILPCDQTEAYAYVRNESCQPTELNQVILPSDVSFVHLTPPQGTWIGPGDSVEVRVRLKPASGSGVKNDVLHLIFRDSSLSEQDLAMKLSGLVLPKIQAFGVETNVALTALDPCSSHDTTITITNHGTCDTLEITEADIAGSPWFSVDRSSLPMHLAVGESATIRIHVATTSDTLATATLRLTGPGVDTTCSLRATTYIPAGEHIASSYSDTIFHAKYCSTDEKQFTLRNRTCGPIEVNGLYLTGDASFAIYPPIPTPFTLAAGDVMLVHVIYSSQSSNGACTLHYTTSDGSTNHAIAMEGIVTTHPRTIRVGIRSVGGINSLTAPPGSKAIVELVVLDDVADSLGLTEITGQIQYDDDLLTLVPGAVGRSGWSCTAASPGAGITTVNLTQPSGTTLTAGSTLAQVPFYVTLAQHPSTAISITNLSLNHGDADYAQCVMTPLAEDEVSLSVEPSCGSNLIAAKLAGSPIRITKVTIDRDQRSRGVVVSINAPHPTHGTLQMLDVTGKVIASTTDRSFDGSTTISLPLPPADGIYFLSLEAEGIRSVEKIAVK